jgi:molecular chaperone DnaK
MTAQPMRQAIEDAALTAEKIDNVLLVGGSTRIPAVQRLVKNVLNKQPLRDISPEEVVALGAAVQTLVLSPIEGDIQDTLATRYGKEKPVIIHVTPFSLGVGLQNDQYGIIIERNSTYPTEAKDIFTTTRDFQGAISFPIYEGDQQIASENTFLDLLRIEGITPAPRGVPRIEVTFKLNPDRILEVRAEDLATGIEKKITILATDTRLSDSDKQRMIKEAKERVSKMLKEKIKATVSESAKEVVSRAQKALSKASSHPLSKELRSKTDELVTLLDQGQEEDLDEKINSILRILTEIEAAG